MKINLDLHGSENEDTDKLINNYTNEIRLNKKIYDEGVKLFIGIN